MCFYAWQHEQDGVLGNSSQIWTRARWTKHNEPEMFGFRSGVGRVQAMVSSPWSSRKSTWDQPLHKEDCVRSDDLSTITIPIRWLCVTWRGLSVPLWLYRSDHHMTTKLVVLNKVTGSTTFFLRVCHMCLRWTCGRPADSDICGTSQSCSTMWGSDHEPLWRTEGQPQEVCFWLFGPRPSHLWPEVIL